MFRLSAVERRRKEGSKFRKIETTRYHHSSHPPVLIAVIGFAAMGKLQEPFGRQDQAGQPGRVPACSPRYPGKGNGYVAPLLVLAVSVLTAVVPFRLA